MKRIQKYNKFHLVTEKVYLSNTIFKKYNLLVDPYSGVGIFNLDLKGGYNEIEMEIQSYGRGNRQFIMRMPAKLSQLPERISIFQSIVKDVLHILNKNRLGFKFELEKIDKERGVNLAEYAIITSDKQMTMEDLERIAQTTKIINAKVKDQDDFDKMIYQTNESYKFDNLTDKDQNILIQIKELIDDNRHLLYANSTDDYPSEPIGGGNPYHKCSYCGQSGPYVDIEGHRDSCQWEEDYRTLGTLKSQLPNEVVEKIDEYIDEISE